MNIRKNTKNLFCTVKRREKIIFTSFFLGAFLFAPLLPSSASALPPAISAIQSQSRANNDAYQAKQYQIYQQEEARKAQNYANNLPTDYRAPSYSAQNTVPKGNMTQTMPAPNMGASTVSQQYSTQGTHQSATQNKPLTQTGGVYNPNAPIHLNVTTTVNNPQTQNTHVPVQQSQTSAPSLNATSPSLTPAPYPPPVPYNPSMTTKPHLAPTGNLEGSLGVPSTSYMPNSSYGKHGAPRVEREAYLKTTYEDLVPREQQYSTDPGYVGPSGTLETRVGSNIPVTRPIQMEPYRGKVKMPWYTRFYTPTKLEKYAYYVTQKDAKIYAEQFDVHYPANYPASHDKRYSQFRSHVPPKKNNVSQSPTPKQKPKPKPKPKPRPSTPKKDTTTTTKSQTTTVTTETRTVPKANALAVHNGMDILLETGDHVTVWAVEPKDKNKPLIKTTEQKIQEEKTVTINPTQTSVTQTTQTTEQVTSPVKEQTAVTATETTTKVVETTSPVNEQATTTKTTTEAMGDKIIETVQGVIPEEVLNLPQEVVETVKEEVAEIQK